jgi:chorismate mutase
MSTLPPSSLTPDEQLREFRRQIDAIDEQVTQLLLDRCGVVKQVGALKSIHWPSPCYIRPAREGQMHEAIAERFVGTDIHPTAAVTIWRQLIGMSTSLESPLTVVNLTAHPHHPWLAREYFGATAGLRQETSLADALDAQRVSTAQAALLPLLSFAACARQRFLTPSLFWRTASEHWDRS